MVDNNLAAPCGIYCGFCRQYLVLKKDLFEEKGLKLGCKGCRIRNKKCAFIRRDCPPLLKNEIDFCHECEEFPCENLENLNYIYVERYSVNLINNLKRIQEIGAGKWLEEQNKLYTCPNCGGEICIHDKECYDCGNNVNPNKK
ncbi:MAG: DUF3795 domain-containing protein [Candidatus Hodarchaeota archaeon]